MPYFSRSLFIYQKWSEMPLLHIHLHWYVWNSFIYSTLEVVWMVMFSFHLHTDNEHTHVHNVSLTQIHSAGESCTSAHSSPWPICYCLSEMYFCEQKARLPTKRQIKRLCLKGRRLWSAAQAETEDMMSHWEMTTALNSHTNLAGTGERCTPTPGWVFCVQYRSHHCFHTRRVPVSRGTELHTHLHSNLHANVFFLCLLEISLSMMDSGVRSGMCPSIPSGDGSKWRFTKSPQSSDSRRDQRNNPQTQANNTALYLDPSSWQLIQFTTQSSDI